MPMTASQTGMAVQSDSGFDAVAWPDDAIEVGLIVDAWGVKGWFKVKAYSSDPQALFSSRRWLLKAPEVPGPRTLGHTLQLPPLLKITAAKEHGDVVVAQAQDLVDRAGAEALRGARVFVSRGSFPTAGPDEYYWVDLVGLSVFNRQGEFLGEVVGLSGELWLVSFESRTGELGHAWLSTKRREGQGMRASGASSPT